MTCCAPTEFADLAQQLASSPSEKEIRLISRALGDGVTQTEISVPAIHCGACMHTIEATLAHVPGVVAARVNLSARRVSLQWQDAGTVHKALECLRTLGYEGHLFEPEAARGDLELKRLIKALAVAGFAATNIMMLSVGVWSGATGSVRDLLHWGSAIIAVPALFYSGRVFYLSAWNAIRHRRTNMDVPITIGVVLALALSLYDTATGAKHAYFDAATSLVFFLLIGRTLDHMMRERARTAVKGLAKLAARGAIVVEDDGSRTYRPLEEIAPGMHLQIAAGERVPVDSIVVIGSSEIDLSLVNGESAPVPVSKNASLHAGTLNLTDPITVRALATASDSFLAEMIRMMEAAESARGPYRQIADRISQIYAPVVHLTAALAFAGWFAFSGDLHHSITVAIAVLIITCPCALGLAVPIVHVVAARKLFEKGIMLKDGEALERLAQVDTVIFDKTGTLTLGKPCLINAGEIPQEILAIAARLGSYSRHPYAQAIAERMPQGPVELENVAETAGVGIEADYQGAHYRLGRAGWAAGGEHGQDEGTVISKDGVVVARFVFEDVGRPGLGPALTALKQQGYEAVILSGDREEIVDSLAAKLGIARSEGGLMPAGKLERVIDLENVGKKVLMVGDGLNDGPALAAASVSMAPANAADVGRNAAGLVFLRESLMAVPNALRVARRAAGLVRENFAIAIGYNLIALPIALAGYATPLIAALAMSASSIVVVGNALRLMKIRLD